MAQPQAPSKSQRMRTLSCSSQKSKRRSDVPDLIEFEPDFPFASLDECKSQDAEESLDELQALNTALCFLCSINADSAEVEAFCVGHPTCLLLEGAGTLPEESARFIVEQQMRRCECFSPMCDQNRKQVVTLLDLGFEYFQSRNWRGRPKRTRPAWNMYLEELLKIEHEIRELRTEEIAMRNRMLETAVEVRACQDELEEFERLEQASKSSALAMLVCTRNSGRDQHTTLLERRSALNYQVGVASLNMSALDREHQDILRQIRDGRRVQFNVLKKAFDGCKRHVCVPTKPKFQTFST